MIEVKFTISSQEQFNRIKAAFARQFRIPETSEGPAFTEQEWVRECIKNHIKNTVKSYEQRKAMEQINIDPNIIE